MNQERARRKPGLAAAGVLAAVLVGVAFWRGGLLGLPSVPPGVTAARAGLADLAELRARAARLDSAVRTGTDSDSALAIAGRGLAALRRGDARDGLAQLRAALGLAPRDLVIGNAYRLAVFHLRRASLVDAARRESLADRVAPELAHEPFVTLEAVRREHPSREATLQLALAWVDELTLFQALEIKAPASIESVNLLTSLLAEDPVYVPALFGRGLNYLNRPARLVWPEERKAAPDAASHDLGLCVAIGRRIGGASPRLVALLALNLGDAYAREGRNERARSWWQISQNASGDPELRAAVQRRFTWRDEEMLDRLERELEHRMLDLDHPLSDLSLIWQ